MSLSQALTRWAIGMLPNGFRSVETVRDSLQRPERPELPATMPRSLRARCVVTEETVDGFRVVTLTPRGGRRAPRALRARGRAAVDLELVYLHGGAYVHTLLLPHWWIIAALMRRTGATVTVPFYGLAPAHTVDDALPFLRGVMRRVRDRTDGRPVFVAGDSAGAGLALAHAIDARDRELPSPAALFLLSPWLDCTMSNPAVAGLQPRDAMLAPAGLVYCGGLWAGARPLTDPLVSPFFDTLEGLPDTYLYQGDHDLFLADAQRFRAKAAATSSRTELRVYRGGFHVFIGATFTPEARRALTHIASVMLGDVEHYRV